MKLFFFLRALPGRQFAVILGVYTVLGFCYAPFPIGFLMPVILVPALLATSSLNYKQAFFCHFAGGIIYNSILYYWLYNVMKVGNPFVILGGLSLMVIYFAFMNGYLGLWMRFFRDVPLGWLWFAFLWTGFEVVRTSGEMSFPWSHLGYGLGQYLPLIQGASVIGIFGYSFLIAASNYWVYKSFINRNRRPLWVLPLVSALFLIYGFHRLSRIEEPQTSVDIALIQPSVEQTKKWDEGYFNQVVGQTYAVMDSADLEGADLIVLAETAIPDFLRRRPEIQENLRLRSRKIGAPLVVGSLDYQSLGHPARPFKFYNSAFLFTPDSTLKPLQYSKLRLVPFSERLPFEDFFPLLNYVDLGEGDFFPGTTLSLWGGSLGYSPSICYEVVYPSYVRDTRRMGARFMVNITNDGWFGRSPAPYQHAIISRFRTIESGLPLARCANSGISVFYDAYGRDLGRTGLFEKRVLRRHLPLHAPNTLYQKFGGVLENTLLIIWMFMQIIALILIGKSFVANRRSVTL